MTLLAGIIFGAGSGLDLYGGITIGIAIGVFIVDAFWGLIYSEKYKNDQYFIYWKAEEAFSKELEEKLSKYEEF